MIRDVIVGFAAIFLASLVVFAADDLRKVKVREICHANEAITQACIEQCRANCSKDYERFISPCGSKAQHALIESCKSACSPRCAMEPK